MYSNLIIFDNYYYYDYLIIPLVWAECPTATTLAHFGKSKENVCTKCGINVFRHILSHGSKTSISGTVQQNIQKF